jgi:hypothetical protein
MTKKNNVPNLTFFLNEQKIVPIILNEAKKQNHIVYGAQAMNTQLIPALRRNTSDIDLYANNPRKAANNTQRKLDKKIAGGKDDFYSRRAVHKGTYRVMHEGDDNRRNTQDDRVVADYTKMQKKVKTKTLDGVRYEHIKSIEKGKRRTLKDPKSKYRHEKDRSDLDRIRLNNQLFNPVPKFKPSFRLGFNLNFQTKRKTKRRKR